MNLIKIRKKIERSWDISTTFTPSEWCSNNRAKGQCATTAMLLRSILNGVIMEGWAILPDGSTTRHFWNKIGGIDVDLTWGQFPVPTVLKKIKQVDGQDVIQNDWMQERLENLKRNYKMA